MSKKTIIIIVIVLVVAIIVALYKKGVFDMIKPKRLMKHFELKEFDTTAHSSELGNKETYVNAQGKNKVRYSGEKNMDKNFLAKIDKARDIIEKGWNKENPTKRIVFIITSGYRSPLYNDSISGSVKGSAHTLGMASDISWIAYDLEQKKAMLAALYEAGFRRFGTATSYVHADVSVPENGHPSPAVWGYPSVKYVNGIEEIEQLALN